MAIIREIGSVSNMCWSSQPATTTDFSEASAVKKEPESVTTPAEGAGDLESTASAAAPFLHAATQPIIDITGFQPLQ